MDSYSIHKQVIGSAGDCQHQGSQGSQGLHLTSPFHHFTISPSCLASALSYTNTSSSLKQEISLLFFSVDSWRHQVSRSETDSLNDRPIGPMGRESDLLSYMIPSRPHQDSLSPREDTSMESLNFWIPGNPQVGASILETRNKETQPCRLQLHNRASDIQTTNAYFGAFWRSHATLSPVA